MNKIIKILFQFILLIILLISFYPVIADSAGNLAKYPPEGRDITIKTSSSGFPKLYPEEITLLTGKYYRLNISCPDVKDDITGWRIEMRELLQNSHLRLVTVGDIEIHLQGLSFNAIECDEIGSAHVSLVTIKHGLYQFYVGNVPSAVGKPIGQSGIQKAGKYVFGKFIVR